MEKTVNCMGMACPLPVINAKTAIEEFKEDGVLKVLVDNDTAVQNLQRLASHKGAECSVMKKQENEFEVTMLVKAGAAGSGAGAGAGAAGTAPQGAGTSPQLSGGSPAAGNASGNSAAAGNADGAGCFGPGASCGGKVVVLSANTMGTGDERLGKKLMNAFIFALTSQDVLPDKVICYNTGAFLTTEGSEALEDLKKLEAAGVIVMTCGTCLDFYGLKEKLKVGIISNMYDIVEAQMNAGSVIRP